MHCHRVFVDDPRILFEMNGQKQFLQRVFILSKPDPCEIPVNVVPSLASLAVCPVQVVKAPIG
jgi:hypothetical protein